MIDAMRSAATVLTFVLMLARGVLAQSCAKPAIATPSPANQEMTAEEVLALEVQSQADPEDLEMRQKLLTYYLRHRRSSDAMAQVLWVVEHHPESFLAGLSASMGSAYKVIDTPANNEALKSAWEHAVSDHRDNPIVLFNAANFFEKTDKERSLELLQEAARIAPGSPSYVASEAIIYEKAFINDLKPGESATPEARTEAASLRARLMESTDPSLLSRVGAVLIRMSKKVPNEEEGQLGVQFMERAMAVDPGNPHWAELFERVKAEPPEPSAADAQPHAVHIGPKIAEANLLTRVEPEYPPLAKAARVQGDVQFTATIGLDGHVEDLQLISGHPLLVAAAKQAAMQWIYRPTLLNGNPVAVVTTVVVPFQLPQ